jgi:predicted ATPase
LYDLLFKFEWLRPHYALQLDGKPISLLSPGEKGALLIVFYLLLDPATSPLIIDQPEHNLDNESIMYLLVPCFKEAARRRQVIVVTHNPNLAVVADADQVIHARIDRADGHRIKYVTGSLESSVVSRLAVNVLEGTLPAFHQRAKVYELIA